MTTVSLEPRETAASRKDAAGDATRTAAVSKSPAGSEAGSKNAGTLTANMLATTWAAMHPELLRLAAALGAGRSLTAVAAGDVLGDVYVIACQQDLAGWSADELRRWLFRVTINRCKLEGRKQSRWRRVWQAMLGQHSPHTTQQQGGQHAAESSRTPSEPATTAANVGPAAEPDAAQQVIAAEHRQLTREALAGLSDELREVLVLRYFHEHNSREIAAILQTSDSTIRSRLRAARLQLAAALQARGIFEPP